MYLYVIKFTSSFLSLSKSLKFSISNIFRFLFAGKNETSGLSDSVVKFLGLEDTLIMMTRKDR